MRIVLKELGEGEYKSSKQDISQQLKQVTAKLGESVDLNPRPIGKKTIGDYTEYVFVDSTKEFHYGGIKNVFSAMSYSISKGGILETKSHIYKTLKDGKFKYDQVDEFSLKSLLRH